MQTFFLLLIVTLISINFSSNIYCTVSLLLLLLFYPECCTWSLCAHPRCLPGRGRLTRDRNRNLSVAPSKKAPPAGILLAAGTPIIPAKRINFSVRAPFPSSGPPRWHDRLNCGVLGKTMLKLTLMALEWLRG